MLEDSFQFVCLEIILLLRMVHERFGVSPMHDNTMLSCVLWPIYPYSCCMYAEVRTPMWIGE